MNILEMKVFCRNTVKVYSKISSLFHSTGISCPSYRPLKGNCEQIVNGTARHWRTVDCYCPSRKNMCCPSWCKLFAKCLSQTSTWKERCARKFYFSFRFTVTTTAIRNDSCPRTFKVKFCRWWFRRKVVAIKITLENSVSGNRTNGLYEHLIISDTKLFSLPLLSSDFVTKTSGDFNGTRGHLKFCL